MVFRMESLPWVLHEILGAVSQRENIQCLTLSPVVGIQSRLASKEDKEYLANTLFYLREPSTGSIEGDILKLSTLIAGYVMLHADIKTYLTSR